MAAAVTTRPEVASHLPPGPPSVLIAASAVGSYAWAKSVWDRHIDKDLNEVQSKEVQRRLDAIEGALEKSRQESQQGAPEQNAPSARTHDRTTSSRQQAEEHRSRTRVHQRERNHDRGQTRD